jgi:hypothetical protein
MLRTQEAALYSVGTAGIGNLCEAICLDAVEVVRAQRVSIWFFAADGSLVCQRMVDAADGRIQQGAVIPPEATEAYLDAASRGLAATVTDNAPALHGGSAVEAIRLDLLLVDGVNAPAAVFRCERPAGAADWSDRDLYVVRSLVQALGAALRRSDEAPRYDKAAGRRRMALPAVGMMPQNLGRLGLDRAGQPSQLDIRLPELAPPSLNDADEPAGDLPLRWGDEGEC